MHAKPAPMSELIWSTSIGGSAHEPQKSLTTCYQGASTSAHETRSELHHWCLFVLLHTKYWSGFVHQRCSSQAFVSFEPFFFMCFRSSNQSTGGAGAHWWKIKPEQILRLRTRLLQWRSGWALRVVIPALSCVATVRLKAILVYFKQVHRSTNFIGRPWQVSMIWSIAAERTQNTWINSRRGIALWTTIQWAKVWNQSLVKSTRSRARVQLCPPPQAH